MTKNYEEYEKILLDYNIKMTYKPFGKDVNKPKRALSAYMLFAGDERPKIAMKNQNRKVTEIMSLVAKAWKELSDDKKAPYIEKAKTLSEKHAKVFEEYKSSAEHVKYLEEKEEYAARMLAKRKRLMKGSAGNDDAENESAKKKWHPKRKPHPRRS